MKQLTFSLLVGLFTGGVVGCSDSSGRSDAGSFDASVPDASAPDAGDAGPLALCEADRDCDDGRYCDGEETCAPGAMGSGADGCLSGAPPCDGGQVCDEAGERCVAPGCEGAEGDRDGDGDPRPECGGADCDDSNPLIFSTATEVCDAEGVDEDCDPSTIRDGSAGSVDGDADRDGYISRGCLNRWSDGTEHRGDDCDDTLADVHPGVTEVCDGVDNNCSGVADDPPGGCACLTGSTRPCGPPEPVTGVCRRSSERCVAGAWPSECPGAVYPTPEVCNGLDDNCNGAEDEDFECIRGEMASGDTVCGHPGTRRCTSSCAWASADYVAAETGRTCDYCDDSGAGLIDEVPFASRTETLETMYPSTPWNLYGVAEFIDLFGLPMADIRLESTDDEVGAAYLATPVQLGYGAMTAVATVQTVSRDDAGSCLSGGSAISGSWSLVLLVAGAASHISSTAGSPLPDEVGIAATWSFADLAGCFPDDVFSLRQLDPGGGRTLRQDRTRTMEQDGPAGSAVTQQLTLEITPDDPATAADESAARVSPTGASVFVACSNEDASTHCGLTFSPGMSFEVGIVARSSDVTVSHPDILTTRSGLCPG